MLWVRVVATIKDSPVLASQAEKVNKNIGREKYDVVSVCFVNTDIAKNMASIIPSRHSRADSR